MRSPTGHTDPASSLLQEVVGLVPAAGLAKRLQPFPCSKEVYPVGFVADATGTFRPKVAAQYLLEKFRLAGITKAYLVIRDGKWDIPNYFRDGGSVGLSLAYIVISGSMGPPDTIDRAYPFIDRKRVAFGFPDILFGPDDAYRQLMEAQERTGAEVVLGLHRVYNPRAWDMVERDADGSVRSIVMKPASTTLPHGWCCALWTPIFSDFLHRFLLAEETSRNLQSLANRANDLSGDLAMGVLLQAALKAGLPMQSVIFPDDTYIDIGTPEDLVRAVRQFHPHQL
ncbi:MAG: putative Nucleotidyl transferase, possible Glucose-phosphate thymidylyltransferase [Nitrospira sp.]|nr:putative Nucleotidyl transferase, possible Glucose-phosphate thymidylyltransferase [Nitrospira sp.]